MHKIPVLMVERVTGSAVTDDGGHTVIWLRTPNDSALPLAIPCGQLPLLIDRCALAHSESQKLAGSDPLFDSNRTAVTWWTSAVDPPSGELRLDLTFGSGGTLSFSLSQAMAEALLTTLQAHYGPRPVEAAARDALAERIPVSLEAA